MGILDAVKNTVGGVVSKAVDIGGDFLGKTVEDQFIGDPNSAKAYSRQKDFYRNRYQWMMKDMKKAGLNPILAAGSAGFSTSGTPSVQQTAKPTSSSGDFASSAKSFAEMEKVTEEAATERTKQMDNLASAHLKIAQKYTERKMQNKLVAEESELFARFEHHWQNIFKMREEIKQIKDQRDLTRAQRDYVERQTDQLKLYMVELGKKADVYRTWVGTVLKYIDEIRRGLGLNIGSAAVPFMMK